MGNTLPCLVRARSSTLPTMNTEQHWSRSIKLLARTIRRNMKRPRHNRVKAAASREASAAEQAAPRTRRGPRNGPNGRSRRVVRVKVVVTRAEAARLLSLTAPGDRTAAQVVGELKRMQVAGAIASAAQAISELRRMEVLARAGASASASTAWRPVLESIPEEWQ